MVSWTPEQLRAHENKVAAKLRTPKPAQQTPALDSASEGKAPSAGFAVVRITMRRQRLLDVDNKYGAIKDLLDGLVYAGLVEGDKEGQISLEVSQIKVSQRASECTEITLE